VESVPALPLEVRGGAPRPMPTSEPTPPEPADGSSLVLVLAAAVVPSSILLLLWRHRRARTTPRAPEPAPATRLFERLESLNATGPVAEAALANALADYLAERLGCDSASVIGPDLPERLTGAGVPGDLARRADRIVETLVAARYGGSPATYGDHDVRALVEELERLELSGD
jgi:hypothetical protein